MTQSLYYSKRNQKCCHQSQKSQTFVFSNQRSQINFLVKNRDCSCGKKELILPETFTVLQEKPNLLHVNRDIDALNFVLSAVCSDRNLSDADALILTWA